MKKEVRQLREKAINSLVLAIDHFNRPWDRGRTEVVLILLDHAFEMLLKSVIRHRQGAIRKPRQKQTIGFDACVRVGLSNGAVKFLVEEQALTLQAVNGLRDAAQHYLIDLSEHQLYFYSQASLTLFRDIHDDVFETQLVLELPERVLPISTTAPKDLSALFDKEVKEIQGLLEPGTRRKMEAVAKARSLAVLESAIGGNYEQPGDSELKKICARLVGGEPWKKVFPVVAAINIKAEHDGPSISLRLTKNEGTPVTLLKEDEGSGAAVAVKRVNELDYYNLGAADLAKKVGLTQPKSLAVVERLGLRSDEDYFKAIKVGGVTHLRYSPKSIKAIKEELKVTSIAAIWQEYQESKKAKK